MNLKKWMRQWSLFLIIGSIFSPQVYAQSEGAGQVIIASGPFQAINSHNQFRSLARGNYFYSGETLLTGTQSSAQVRFTDGTVLALYPNSRIKIDDYVYEKNSQTDKSIVSLVKGGFRALTGLISKANPKTYQINTPVAVIGVRGTNYGAMLDKGELYTGVWKGGIYVKNEKGLIQLGEGEDYNFAVVSSKNVSPEGLLNAPSQLIGQCGVN